MILFIILIVIMIFQNDIVIIDYNDIHNDFVINNHIVIIIFWFSITYRFNIEVFPTAASPRKSILNK